MSTKLKRGLALLLTVAMMFSMAPGTALNVRAEGPEVTLEQVTESEQTTGEVAETEEQITDKDQQESVPESEVAAPAETEAETEPATEEPAVVNPADGDYVLYVKAYGKALSQNYGGNYNNGVDLTAPEGAASVEAYATEV